MTYRTALKSTALAAVLSTASAFSAQAVFFHIGSGSIDGSLCVGNDCVASPAFGFDTVILRENNLRFLFDDTSSAASFPDNDWRLTANDSANGGAEHFSIEDASAGRFVFRVFAGARSNALVVDSQGDVGIGTATPVVELHAVRGDTPTLRLEQDGSSGFTPQTWDVAGNEAGFFVRDATNGSTLPFRIIPGASSQSLVIDDDDDIGMGAGTNPQAALHVERSNGTAKILVEENQAGFATQLELLNNGAPRMQFDNSASADEVWQIGLTDPGDTFVIRHESTPGAAGNVFNLDSTGDLTISGGLVTGTAGSCTAGTPCDAVFDPSVYTVPSIDEYAAFMWENQHLPAVGPTRAGEPVNVTKKMLAMLNELEHAHIYIEQLHERLNILEDKLAKRN